MPVRRITIGATPWEVTYSGRVTAYERDEFGLVFVSGDGPERQVRVTRYSPQGSRWREQSLAEMTDDDLRQLFEFSQPSWTSPETGYRP